MLINLSKFTGALEKVTAFASMERNPPGVLLDIQEDYINVCYSDGRKSIIETVDAVVEDGDRKEKIVVDYNRLVDVISACQPSGRIQTDDIEIIFNNDKENTLNIKVEKKVSIGDDEDDSEQMTVSVFEQTLGWVPANANRKVAIISRMDYDSIFKEEDTDSWDIADFRKILDKTTNEQGRVVYVSPSSKIAFVSNMAFMSCVPIESGYTYPMIFPTAIAKALNEVLGKVGNRDSINIHLIDKKYCSIYTNDKKVGIWVEMVDANEMHLTTLKRYQSKEYKNYQVTLIREALQNVINAALTATKTDRTVLRFNIDEEGLPELKITGDSSRASVSNEYTIMCMECIDRDDNIEELELPVSLKVLLDILNKCETDFVGIDIDIDESGSKSIRIAELDEDANEKMVEEVMNSLGIGEDDEIPTDEKLGYRDKVLGGRHYTLSAR